MCSAMNDRGEIAAAASLWCDRPTLLQWRGVAPLRTPPAWCRGSRAKRGTLQAREQRHRVSVCRSWPAPGGFRVAQSGCRSLLLWLVPEIRSTWRHGKSERAMMSDGKGENRERGSKGGIRPVWGSAQQKDSRIGRGSIGNQSHHNIVYLWLLVCLPSEWEQQTTNNTQEKSVAD